MNLRFLLPFFFKNPSDERRLNHGFFFPFRKKNCCGFTVGANLNSFGNFFSANDAILRFVDIEFFTQFLFSPKTVLHKPSGAF